MQRNVIVSITSSFSSIFSELSIFNIFESSRKSGIFFFVSNYDEIYENSVFNGQNEAAKARGARKNRRSAKKALVRGRKYDNLLDFNTEKLLGQRMQTFSYNV